MCTERVYNSKNVTKGEFLLPGGPLSGARRRSLVIVQHGRRFGAISGLSWGLFSAIWDYMDSSLAPVGGIVEPSAGVFGRYDRACLVIME